MQYTSIKTFQKKGFFMNANRVTSQASYIKIKIIQTLVTYFNTRIMPQESA